MLLDGLGRKITYLRVSVTDRCNLRCSYCMPREGVKLLPHAGILRYEEIAQVVCVAAEQGVRAVRLTGGEPLVRPNLPELVRMIADIPGIEDISLTSNGILLERQAARLKEAGLKRINISLDTLDPLKYARVTRGGSFEAAWRGIEAAEKAGLAPLKINVVAVRGFNEDELLALARLSQSRGWNVRFIELMPLSNQAPWGADLPDPSEAFLPIDEMKAILAPLDLEPICQGKQGEGPAKEYRMAGAEGTIGFIAPLSEHFCERCNRMRLTADGHFRPCLVDDSEIAILPALRRGEPVLPYLRQAVEMKPAGHELAQRQHPTWRGMQQIGG